MVEIEFWDYILNLRFLVGFGIVGAAFLPLLYSIWLTWQNNAHKERAVVREARRLRRLRRRAVVPTPGKK